MSFRSPFLPKLPGSSVLLRELPVIWDGSSQISGMSDTILSFNPKIQFIDLQGGIR